MTHLSILPSTTTLREFEHHTGVPVMDILLLGVSLLHESSAPHEQHVSSHKKSQAQESNTPSFSPLSTRLRAARTLIRMGSKAYAERKKTVSFHRALDETLKAKGHRRPRTLAEIRSIGHRLMREVKGLASRPIRSMTASDWDAILHKVFTSPRQRYKARIIVHGIFNHALRKDWCSDNPLKKVDIPPLRETPVRALSLSEIRTLRQTAETYDGGSCLIPLALMMYAGIRPDELRRLSYDDINLHDKIISLRPEHTKTGGARHVTIEPVLRRILVQAKEKSHPLEGPAPLCPKNWSRRWKELRRSAGWVATRPWQQDCLRHTYASYHALYYKDFTRLQYEMGHRSSTLLRTRYLNMQGLSPRAAQAFWKD